MHSDDLLKMAKKGKHEELEAAWMTTVAGGPHEVDLLLRVPKTLSDRNHRDLAETLTWYLIDSLREAGETEQAYDAARTAARFVPQSQPLRDALADLYIEMNSAREDATDLVTLTLKNRDLGLQDAIATLDNLLAFRPGSYVLDPQHGEVGRVEGFDAEKGGIAIDFGGTVKTYSGVLLGRLQPVDKDDFRALAAFETERLGALSDEDPEELVSLLLGTLDKRMELRRIRLYLEPVLAGPWTKWWGKAREVLKRSSAIGMTEGRNPSLFLRSKPLSHGERLARKFETGANPMARLNMALEILQEARDKHVGEDTVRKVHAGVKQLCAQCAAAGKPALAVAAGAVADAYRRRLPDYELDGGVPPQAMDWALTDPAAFVRVITDDGVLLCALDAARRQAHENWKDFFVAVMPNASRDVCGALARQLEAEDARAHLAAARRGIIEHSDRNPGSIAWLWRDVTSNPKAAEDVKPVEVVREILSMAAGIFRDPSLSEEMRRDHVNLLRNALFMKDGEPLREAMESAPPEEVALVKAYGERNPALTDQRMSFLMDILRDIQPDLFVKFTPPWEQGVVYSTEAGIDKRKKELEYIVNERLPEVIKQLGQAAEFGDLRENAEYKAALEERARLADQGARIQEEIAEARVITHETADTDFVTIGSEVLARNLDTNEELVMTFLGPWDARPEENVYAYNAPLGLAFMGATLGQDVEYDTGTVVRRWKVLEVKPAL